MRYGQTHFEIDGSDYAIRHCAKHSLVDRLAEALRYLSHFTDWAEYKQLLEEYDNAVQASKEQPCA